MSRIEWDYAEVQKVARAAHEAGKRMNVVVAERYGISTRYASRVISIARRHGHEIPTDLGWSKTRPGSGKGRTVARFPGMKHGDLATYRAGCHCRPCRLAFAKTLQSKHVKEWRPAETLNLNADKEWPYDWRTSPNRACLSDNINNYFNMQHYDRGRKVCAGCPELEPCRAFAIRDPELQGLWGGLSERQRLIIRTRKVVRL